MSKVTVENLISAGVHFGHPASSWDPKMEEFIYGKRNLIHIIDVKETMKGLFRAAHVLRQLAARGDEILLVGTKRQARQLVEETAKDLDIPYVSERWLGGMLTNFQTIRQRLKRLEEIEQMEETGLIEAFSKKMISSLMREKRKIKRNLEGIRHMDKLPQILVIIDPKREYIAVREAEKLDIPTVAVIDTDSDPDLIDIPIPGNDDAYRSIAIILNHLADAVKDGHEKYASQQQLLKKQKEADEKAAKEKAEREKAAREKAKKEAKEAKKSKVKEEEAKKTTAKTASKSPRKAEAAPSEKKAEKAAKAEVKKPAEDVGTGADKAKKEGTKPVAGADKKSEAKEVETPSKETVKKETTEKVKEKVKKAKKIKEKAEEAEEGAKEE